MKNKKMFPHFARFALLAFYATAKAAFPTAVNNQMTLTTPNSVTDEIINPTNETMMAPNPEVSRPDALVVDAIKKWSLKETPKAQELLHNQEKRGSSKIHKFSHGVSPLDEEAAYNTEIREALNTPVNTQITSKAPPTEETRREKEVAKEDQDARAPSSQRRARR